MLDTSVLVSGLPDHVIEAIEDYCSSMICRAELAQGLAAFSADPARRAQAAQRAELLRILDAVPGFWRDFDAAASDGYGRLTAQPKATRLKDALIAGHALSEGLPLHTEDRGFTGFADVRIVLAG